MTTKANWTLIGALLLLVSTSVPAGEYETCLREGNRLYAAEDYAGAEEKYILARNERQDSAAATFNIGNTYFERQDYQRAIENYREALNHVQADRGLEVRIKYNLATARVRESERSIGDITDPEKLQTGVNFLTEAIRGYRDVLEIDPEHSRARHNLAICQLRIKNLLDTLKRLREEAEKNRKDQQGKSPVEILRELIAEEEAEIGLSQTARDDSLKRSLLDGQLRRVEEAAKQSAVLADAAAATAGPLREALEGDVRALEEDAALVVGGAELSRALRDLEEGGTGKESLGEARRRLEEALKEAGTRLLEGLDRDRADQEGTRNRALGLVQGLRDRADGKPPPAPPGGTGPPQPAPQPPPPEVAEQLRRVAEHTETAAGEMEAALGLLGEKGSERIASFAQLITEQQEALEALRKALEEAEKLPGQEPPPQQGDPNQQQEDGDRGDEKKDQEQQDRGEGERQKDGEKDEKQLSREEAEEMVRRFLRKDREREKRRARRRVVEGGGRPGLEKDW